MISARTQPSVTTQPVVQINRRDNQELREKTAPAGLLRPDKDEEVSDFGGLFKLGLRELKP